ncbi:sushi, von Willebrand factor type A, EGF and pentraxin domain-containing protein 1-like [Halichondria panicea]|uniref:sushi, von Willebrand factor type A, EGF and pentraxin domain-containing protein 1-like n=1 Tax=Halichondria panicea TaxID=6063 RepID=UPI00312BA3C8
MHEYSMKNLQGDCVSWLVLLTGAAQLLLVCGEGVYLSSGSTKINNKTEIIITDIGEDGGLPSLTCHTDLTTCCRSMTDNNGNGSLGQWMYPTGSVILGNGASLAAGQKFYVKRNAPQLIKLNRREINNPLTPTGSYCCTVPTTGGEITLCANLVVCLSLPPLTNGIVSYNDSTLGLYTVATHSCDTGYTLNGDTTRTCGNDGMWSEPAPSSCERICSDLPLLTNGMIFYSGTGSANNRPVDTVATFSCDTGYTLNGGATKTCESDGMWSGLDPVCQRICSDLPLLTNGIIFYSGTGSTNNRPVDTVVTFSCDTGYTLNGGATKTCESDGMWSGLDPVCQRICSDLPLLTNGMIFYSGTGSANNRPVDTVATFSCDTGYTLNGGATKICESDGMWSGLDPVCQRICSDLPSLTNGMISYSGAGSANNRPVDTVATFSCDTGYTLNGGTTKTCESDGMWSGLDPVCQRICSDLPLLTNGMISYFGTGSANKRTVDTVATFSCDTGYTLNGGTTKTCESDGMWSGLDPVCQRICSDLPSLTNGMISYSGAGSTNNRPVDTVATFSCDTGYTLNEDATKTCGSDGMWSGLDPVCQRICSDLPLLTNGMIFYSGTGSANKRTVDTVAIFSCDTGYTLNGGATKTCESDGMWSGLDPVCQRICSDLPLLTNGMVSYFGTGSTNNRPVDTVATFSCDTGYTLNGGSTKTCESDRMWSGLDPVCQRICSDLPSLTNGMISYSGAGSTNNRPVDTVATFSCDTGYTLNGGATKTCGSDGMWSGLDPVCQRICSDLLLLTNGMIFYSGTGSANKRTVDTVAIFSCDTGYTLNGGATKTCESDGMWSGLDPVCQRKWNGMWTFFIECT